MGVIVVNPYSFTTSELAETATLVAAMTVEPTTARRTAINTLISDLKACGAWDRFDRLYITAAHHEQAAKLDWIAPGTDSLVTTGTIAFDIDRGFRGTVENSASGTGNVRNSTNFSALTNFTRDDNHASCWAVGYRVGDQNAGAFGASSGTTIRIAPHTGVFNACGASNSSFTMPWTTSQHMARGWFMADRIADDEHTGWVNGELIGTGAVASVAAPASTMDMVRTTAYQMAMMSCGSSMADIADEVYAAFLAYMQHVGVERTFDGAWGYDWTTNPSLVSSEGFVLDSYFPSQCFYDWEGVPRFSVETEAVFAGYRRVRNLMTDTDPVASASVVTQTVTVVSGREYRLSFTGTGSIAVTNAATATLEGQGASARVASAVLTAGSASMVLTVTGDVRKAQLEDVTHQSNQNPSEYASVGALAFPYHGTKIDGIKYFTTQNGNTVASELVTEASGAALNASTVLKGLQYYMGDKNVCLQSENFGTTWSAVGSPTRSAAATSCGDVVLDLIGDDDGSALEGYTQAVTFTAVGAEWNNFRGVNLFFKEGTSTSTAIRLRDTSAGADRLLAVITWADGVPTVTMTTGTLLELEGPLHNDVYRARMMTTAVTRTNTNQIEVYPATDAALATTATGNINIGGMECTDRAFSVPYIKTTTAAVTRAMAWFGDAERGGLSWVNQDEGTFVTEFMVDYPGADGVQVAQNYNWQLRNIAQGAAYRLIHLTNDGMDISFLIYNNSVNQTQAASDEGLAKDTIIKTACAYKANDSGFYVDGVEVFTDASVTLPSATHDFDGFAIGSPGSDSGPYKNTANISIDDQKGFYRKLAYYQSRRSDLDTLSTQ